MRKKQIRNIIMTAGIMSLIAGIAFPVLAASQNRTITAGSQIRLLVNGQEAATKDKDGKDLTPVTIDGIVYIPAQAVSNLPGVDMEWSSSGKELHLYSKSVYSSADSKNYIGLEKAKQIALQHAGISAADAYFYKAELDRDDGSTKYDIEFYSSNIEYEYDIAPDSGAILKWDYDTDENHRSTSASGSAQIISLEQARALAKAKAPDAELYSCKLDHDDGKQVYEGELRKGRTEYEFKIDAVTGKFLKWEIDED